MDLKPAAQFALLLHTDAGLLAMPLAPLTDNVPGGLELRNIRDQRGRDQET